MSTAPCVDPGLVHQVQLLVFIVPPGFCALFCLPLVGVDRQVLLPGTCEGAGFARKGTHDSLWFYPRVTRSSTDDVNDCNICSIPHIPLLVLFFARMLILGFCVQFSSIVEWPQTQLNSSVLFSLL